MDLLQEYDSQVSDGVDEVDGVDIMGTQEYGEEFELDDSLFGIVPTEPPPPVVLDLSTTSRSRSRSPGVTIETPNLDTDALPARRARRFANKSPTLTEPRGSKKWTMDEITATLNRCQLVGQWKQGGVINRAVFEADDMTYLVNFHSGTVWVQGRRALEIDAKLRAARSAQSASGA